LTPQRKTEALSPQGQLLWGALGAIAPYAAKAIQAVGFKTSYPFPHLGLGFISVFLIMVVLGAIWSRALESHNRWLAMYHAATFPIVFQFLFGSHGP
jgi:hypothetical protein